MPAFPVPSRSRPVHPLLSRAKPDLQALSAALRSDQAWADQHLPLVRGAVALAGEDDRSLRRRYAALGEHGPALIRERIALLDEASTHLRDLGVVLHRARVRLAGLAATLQGGGAVTESRVPSTAALAHPTVSQGRAGL